MRIMAITLFGLGIMVAYILVYVDPKRQADHKEFMAKQHHAITNDVRSVYINSHVKFVEVCVDGVAYWYNTSSTHDRSLSPRMTRVGNTVQFTTCE